MPHYTLDNTEGYTQNELDDLSMDLALDVFVAFTVRRMLGLAQMTNDELAALVTQHHQTVKGWHDASEPQ